MSQGGLDTGNLKLETGRSGAEIPQTGDAGNMCFFAFYLVFQVCFGVNEHFPLKANA